MLRFHKFTIGAAWISDYGDPDTPDGSEAAHAYSPLHRITEGTQYPPTLILTADHDDRVVPLHSFKFAAALQAASPSDAWLRVESSAGHGAGKSLEMVASEWADLLAFAEEHEVHERGERFRGNGASAARDDEGPAEQIVPAIGGAESGRNPFQSASQSGASARKARVPNASGRAISRLPS